MRVVLRLCMVVAVLSSVAVRPSMAQSPQEIFDRMLSEYERRIASVDNYVVEQEMMGVQNVMYFEKEMADGRPVMRLKQNTVGGMNSRSDEDDSFSAMYTMVPQFIEHASYAGRDEVEGRAVHVIDVADLDQIDFGRSMGDEDFTPKHGTFYIDTDLWIPRRMTFTGELKTDEGPREVTSVVDLLDYRDVGGMLHPFRTSIRIEGMGAAIDPEMRKQYEEMKQRLAEMPASQRAMAERMMKGQMEQIEKMMSGGDDSMTVETTVKDIRVNQGPPK
jgi:hypothetical protein